MVERRKLAAILAADVVGYSRLAAADEERTLARLRALRSDLLDPTVAVHRGRVVKRTGDGALVEFHSVVEAVRCAVELQSAMIERNAGLPPERRIELRIGVHLGDVVEESDGDLMGDGVNIAARLEGIAAPGAICLSEDAYRQVRARLDLEVRDLGETTLKNIAEPIRVYALEVRAAAPGATAPADRAPAKPAAADTPSIAGGDAEQEIFADGLTEDIITTLSKLAGLRVTARNSSFVYKGRAVDVREAAEHLGVRYVLEGSVRKGGQRLRVTAQLIDARSGSHLWAERYDRAFDDIFAIQDEITMVLATEMQVKLTEGEQARLHYTTTSNVEAWTHWVQGLFFHRQAVTRENCGQALRHWQRALALDPDSAVLNAMIGFIHYVDARFGWWDDRATAVAKGRGHVDRALVLDPGNPDACMTEGLLFLFQARWDEAAASARRALRLAPNAADVATLACFVLAMAGFAEEAVAEGERALTLSPAHPGYYLGHLGNAYRLAGRLPEAIAAFEAYDARHPGFGLVDLVLIHRQTGRPEAARRAAERLLAVRREFTIASWRDTQFPRDPARLDAEIAALAAAGLPPG
jgi:adenylate cyclase